MKRIMLLVLIMCAPLVPAQQPESTVTESQTSIAHVSNSFAFTVDAPLQVAAPLFGPEGERAWAGDDWNPQFIFPVPARDVEGAVFTVRHGEHTAVWVNTLFDLKAGHMHYVYVLANLLVTTIDVRLHAIDTAGAMHTRVDVTYVAPQCGRRRTATLSPSGSTTGNRQRYGRAPSTPICSAGPVLASRACQER
jgi:hypothetical protein